MIALLGDSLSVGAFPYLQALVPEVRSYAKTGATIPQMQALVPSIELDGARLVLVMGATNDLASLVIGPTDALARLDRLATELEARKLPAVYSTIPPEKTNNGPKARAFNALLLGGALGPSRRVVDVGNAASEADLAPDGIHLSPAGYKRLGAAWASVVQGSTPAPPPVVVVPPVVPEDKPEERASTTEVLLGVGVALGVALLLARAYRR